jgi:GAF domain-containing protein
MAETQEAGWQRFIEQLLTVESYDPTLRRRGRLTAAILLTICSIAAIWLAASLALMIWGDASLMDAFRPAIILPLAIIVYAINRRGFSPVAGMIFAGVMLAFSLAALYTSGPLTTEAISLAVPVLLAGLLGPPAAAVLFVALAIVGYGIICVLTIPDYLGQIVTNAAYTQTILVHLNLAFVGLVAWLFSRAAGRALVESEQLSLALVAQREELERRLESQTRHLQATITVSHAVAGARDLDRLLTDIVDTVREYFGYYHVQIFMVDHDTRYAILRQSTGDAGRKLLTRGHRLPVGSMSVIGQVTATGRPVVARDTDIDPIHRANELLPRTRSEMALPLVVGEHVIGALDIQSVEADAFDLDTMPALRAMADQLSIAIENARLYEEAQANLRELTELSQEITSRSWAEFLEAMPASEYRIMLGPEDKSLATERETVIERVLATGSVMASSGGDGRLAHLAAPIVIRDQVIGVLGVEPDDRRVWTQDDLLLIQSVAERTALAIENARLYIQARRAAERERLVSTISDRLQRAPNLALLLESAAAELSSALGTEQVYAELSLGGGDEPIEPEDDYEN